MRTTREHLTAAYVALHLLLMGVMALPDSASEREWERAAPWFQAWSNSAATIGVAVSADRVEEGFRFANGIVGGIGTVFEPLTGPLDRYLGLDQHWGMFSSVPQRSARLEIQVLLHDGWEPLYVARSSMYDWRRRQLDHERFRTYINNFAWKRNRREFRRFAAWISDQARREIPDARKIRVQMREVEFVSPQELRRLGELPKGTVYWTEDDRSP